MMNKNNLKTSIFLAAICAFFVVIGRLLLGGTGALIFLFIGFAFCGGSYWFSDKLAIKAAGAQLVTEHEMPEYYATVRDLASRANMPMPQLYVAPSPQPNAFATGRNPDHAAVAVTQGILQMLSWDELKGVLAHEMSHVKNRDILISSVAAAVATAILYLTQFGMFFGGSDEEDRPNPVVLIGLMILAPIAASLMQMALSRSREYEADHDGAELLGGGESLATALQKIERGAEAIPMNIDQAHAQAYIINPFSGRKVSFAGWFRSHPPTEDRIARLHAQSFRPSNAT